MHKIQISCPDAMIIGTIIHQIKQQFPTAEITTLVSNFNATKKTIQDVVDCLNNVCNTSYKSTRKSTVAHINARLSEGFTIDDFRHVICFMNEQWGSDPKMSTYLRPETLFGTKFEGYLMAAKKDSEPVLQRNPQRRKPEVAL